MSAAAPVRVLIVDDSAVVRQLLGEMLARDPGIDVVGTAADPLIAREKIQRLRPDVLTLDIEMPRMSGLEFLEQLMRMRPMPVVMVSTLTERGAAATLQALSLGAVDVVAKPKASVAAEFERSAADIVARVKHAAKARIRPAVRGEPTPPVSVLPARTPAIPSGPSAVRPMPATAAEGDAHLIALGASAGGTEALRVVLQGLPAHAPAVVLAQHLPANFSAAFAERLDRHSAMHVREARDGEDILPGHAYIPPGGRHLAIVRHGRGWRCAVEDGPPVNRHKPAVDVLFHSVARHAGARAIGALLTGMGDDGARGLLAMRAAGARTLVQDEATSVVWGMPGAAMRLGAAADALPLDGIASRLLELSRPHASVA